MESVHDWEELVPETKVPSAESYGNYKYPVTINYEDAKEGELKIVEVDFWDAFYVHQFSLVHIQTGEDIGPRGVNAGDKFRNRWMFKSPPKGEYLVTTKGGAHKYSVSVLRCDRKLPEPLEYTVENSITVNIMPPKRYSHIPKILEYRMLGEEKWRTMNSESPHNEFKLEVDSTKTYEVKARLVYIKDQLISEYSPITIIKDHQTWIDQLQPDPFLFDECLWFSLPSPLMESWRYRTKPVLIIKFGKERLAFESSRGLYRLKLEAIMATDLQKKLTKDTVIEWQLQFVDSNKREYVDGIKFNQIVVAESKFNKFKLKKRQNFLGKEFLQHNNHLLAAKIGAELIISPNGTFMLYFQKLRKEGNFTIVQQNNKFIMKLYPKYREEFAQIEFGLNESILVPEILTQIFEHCKLDLIPEDQCKQLAKLSLVSKYWFNIFKRAIVLEGDYHPTPHDYYKSWQLDIPGWDQFK